MERLAGQGGTFGGYFNMLFKSIIIPHTLHILDMKSTKSICI